jgi:hypothetical protein
MFNESWVMIQKQSNGHCIKGAHNTKSKKGAVGHKFNEEHAHCLFYVKESVRYDCVFPNYTFSSDFHCDSMRRLRKYVTSKTGTLVQPQLASSWQHFCPHIPENQRVYH